MKILINDKFQKASGVPDLVKSPALADVYNASNTFTATFSVAETVNCIGLGYTDATQITLTGSFGSIVVPISKTFPNQNGLYVISAIITTSITVTHNGTFIGRVGAGEYRQMGTSPSKEQGYYDTNENRETNSGSVIPGAGGYSGRRVILDVRYKITEEINNDIETAYPLQIAKGFPYFLDLTDETHKLPKSFEKFYAKTEKPISLLQSSTRRYLYSYKFNFFEKF